MNDKERVAFFITASTLRFHFLEGIFRSFMANYILVQWALK